MKPLPRWMNVLAVLAVVFGALNTASVLTIVSPTIGGVIAGAAAVVSYASNHITTDGLPVGFGVISLITGAFGTLNAVTYVDANGLTVQVLSLLPPSVGVALTVLGAIGTAFSAADHKDGKVLGTATITGS